MRKIISAAVIAITLAGCGQVAVKQPHQSATQKINGRCTIGYVPTGQGAVFTSGEPRNQVINGTTSYPVVSYQVTLTDPVAAMAEVNGWVVVFYDPSGTELGSDEETVSDTFLTTGQSLTWTEYAPGDTTGKQANWGSDQSIPSDGSAASCQLVHWTHLS